MIKTEEPLKRTLTMWSVELQAYAKLILVAEADKDFTMFEEYRGKLMRGLRELTKLPATELFLAIKDKNAKD